MIESISVVQDGTNLSPFHLYLGDTGTREGYIIENIEGVADSIYDLTLSATGYGNRYLSRGVQTPRTLKLNVLLTDAARLVENRRAIARNFLRGRDLRFTIVANGVPYWFRGTTASIEADVFSQIQRVVVTIEMYDPDFVFAERYESFTISTAKGGMTWPVKKPFTLGTKTLYSVPTFLSRSDNYTRCEYIMKAIGDVIDKVVVSNHTTGEAMTLDLTKLRTTSSGNPSQPWISPGADIVIGNLDGYIRGYAKLTTFNDTKTTILPAFNGVFPGLTPGENRITVQGYHGSKEVKMEAFLRFFDRVEGF